MLKKYNGNTISLIARLGCFEANTFGRSSQKSKTIIVIKIIWIVRIRFTLTLYILAISSAIDTETIDAATLATVLPTNIVMSSLLGNAIKLLVYRKISLEDLKSSSRFFCFIEKNATSDPEKKAESNNSTTSKNIWNNQSISKKLWIL